MSRSAPTRKDGAAVAGAKASGGKSSGGKSGGGGTAAPDTLFTTATLRLVDLLGEGEIGGVRGGLAGVYLNDVPIQNEDGTLNFRGISVAFREGAPDQPYMPGFTDVESPTAVGVKATAATPVVASVANPNADRVRVTLEVPALLTAKTDGSVRENSVSYRIEIRAAGGPWVNALGDQTLTGKASSPFFPSHEIALPAATTGSPAPWQVRLTRLSPDTDDFNTSQDKFTVQSDLVFQSLTEIIDAKFTYPHSAVVGIEADVASFGASLPTRKYLVDGIKMPVPSNYDPALRSYDGIWDGTFKEAVSDNPAWALHLLLQNDRFGLGEFIDGAGIDKWTLYQIGVYCDGAVPDGHGGMEPRFTFNGAITSQHDAFELLELVAQIFRGMTFWSSGAVTAGQDRPGDPVLLVTPANVLGDGGLSYASSSRRARHTVAIVAWNDPSDLYRTTYEVVEDADGIARYGYNPTKVDLLGCTSQGQAHRAGLWALFSDLHETQVLTYRAGLDHAVLRPGDLIAVQDPHIAGIDASGRLLAGATAGRLPLDRPVTLQAGIGYTISVTLPDGSVAERPVVNAAPGQAVEALDLKDSLPAAPDPAAVWVLAGDVVPRLFRVVSIKETEPHVYEIQALQHEPGKFDAIDRGATFVPDTVSQLPRTVAPPRNLAVRESQYYDLQVPRQSLTLSWTAGDALVTVGYAVTAIEPDGAVVTLPQRGSVSADFTDVSPGEWTFLVTAIGVTGATSAPARLTTTVSGWQGRAAPTVTGLAVKGGGSAFAGRSCTLAWGHGYPDGQDAFPVVDHVTVFDASTNALLHAELLPVGQSEWTYDYLTNVNEGGPRRQFRVGVAARGPDGREGTMASLLVANAPPGLVAPRLDHTSEAIFVEIAQPADPDWAGFLIWASTRSGFDPLKTAPAVDTGDTLTTIPADPGTTYYLRAAAYDAFGKNPAELNISAEAAVTVTNQLWDTSAPAIPGTPTLTSAAETAQDGTVTAAVRASWTASGGNFAGAYQVAVAQGGGDFVLFGAAGERWETHGLPPNVAVQVKVRAVAREGFGNASGWSSVATITTAANTNPPGAVSTLAATSAFQNAFLTWTPSSSADVAFVEIWSLDQASTAAAPPAAAILRAKVPARASSFSDNALADSRTYWARPVNTSGVAASSFAGPVRATSPQITAGQLANGIVDATKFASSIAPTGVVSTLPAAKTTAFVTLSTDGKLYRWDPSAGKYTAAVAAGDIAGQITGDQIAGLSAAKLTSQIVATQITDGAISTAKLAAGAVVASTLATGAVTASKLQVASQNLLFNANHAQGSAGLAAGTTTGQTVTLATDAGLGPQGTVAAVARLAAAAGQAGSLSVQYGLAAPSGTVRRYPVTAGQAYEFSAFLSGSGLASASVALAWYDSSGNALGQGTGTAVTALAAGGAPLSVWGRSAVIATAPSGAATVAPACVAAHARAATPVLVVALPMFAPAAAGQTEASPYVDPAVTTISGGNLATGTVTATQIDAGKVFGDLGVFNALKAGIATFGGLKADQLAAGAITADKIGVGLGAGNLVWGSDGRVPAAGVRGWNNLPSSATGLYVGPNREGATWQPPEMGSIETRVAGTVGSASQPYVMDVGLMVPQADGSWGAWMPCQPGQRYEFSSFLSVHRCDAFCALGFSGADGTYLGETTGNLVGYDTRASGPLSNWPRSGGFAVAPGNAVRMLVFARASLTGGSEPYLFATGFSVATAQPNQTQISAWTPQSTTVVNGGQVATNSLNADRIVAGSITSDRFTTNTLDAAIISADTFKARVINTGALTADNITVGTGTLTSVFGGSNTTKINGGAIDANTIDASRLYVGQRGIVFTNVEFYQERDGTGALTGKLCWTSGEVNWKDAGGTARARSVKAGSVARGNDGWQTVWWDITQPDTLQASSGNTVGKVQSDPNCVLCATSADATGICVYFGGARVDGSKITALSISAGQIAAGQIQTQHMSANTISGDRITANSLVVEKLASGTLTAGLVYVGNSTFYLENKNGSRLGIQDGTRIRAALGNLSPWGINDYSLAVWDAQGNLVLGPNGLRAASLTGTVAASQIGAGAGGTNLLTNAAFALGTLGISAWSSDATNYPIGVFGVDVSDGAYILNSGHTVAASLNRTPPSGIYADVFMVGVDNRRFPCVAGQRIEASAYVCSHRGTRQLYVLFFDGAGKYVPGWAASAVLPARNTTCSDLGGYDRIGLFATVPSGAYQMSLLVRLGGQGEQAPYLFITRPYLGLALPNQTEFSPWSAPGQTRMDSATASFYMADATIGNAQVGTLSAGKIAVNALSAFTANVGTVTAGLLQSGDGLMQVDLNNKRIVIGQ